jgi:mono/diheme cytochrome c family protein
MTTFGLLQKIKPLIMKNFLVVLTFYCVTTVEAQPVKTTFENGKTVFQNNCIRCHGHDGKLGKQGAKNLQISKLNDNQLLAVISNGKWAMPKWKKVLTPEQLSAVTTYVKALRSK